MLVLAIFLFDWLAIVLLKIFVVDRLQFRYITHESVERAINNRLLYQKYLFCDFFYKVASKFIIFFSELIQNGNAELTFLFFFLKRKFIDGFEFSEFFLVFLPELLFVVVVAFEQVG